MLILMEERVAVWIEVLVLFRSVLILKEKLFLEQLLQKIVLNWKIIQNIYLKSSDQFDPLDHNTVRIGQ